MQKEIEKAKKLEENEGNDDLIRAGRENSDEEEENANKDNIISKPPSPQQEE